jgi:ATP-dependent phosphoenolpyruvate carboxykinase
MKSQIITQTVLTAEEGFFLTDGETYGKTVVLPADADPSVWREVAEEALPKEEENV